MGTSAELQRPWLGGLLVLWFGVLGGPIAWIIHLLLAYALVPVACLLDLVVALYALSLFTGLIALAADLVSWRTWQRARQADTSVASATTFRTASFMGLSGLLLGTLFLGAIVAQTVPIVIQDPCTAAGRLFI